MPIENSPPGIQAMPSGAGPEGRARYSIVGAKSAARAGARGAASRVVGGANRTSQTRRRKRMSPFPSSATARLELPRRARVLFEVGVERGRGAHQLAHDIGVLC